ncbi:hypothetical protein [Dehalobacter sp. 4CP]
MNNSRSTVVFPATDFGDDQYRGEPAKAIMLMVAGIFRIFA